MTILEVPVPAGCEADEWRDDGDGPHRFCDGTARVVELVRRLKGGGNTPATVRIFAAQTSDGRAERLISLSGGEVDRSSVFTLQDAEALVVALQGALAEARNDGNADQVEPYTSGAFDRRYWR